jgi:uncharacterized membrane protein
MHILTRRDWTALALIVVYSFIPAVVGLLRIPELLGGPAIAPPNPRAVVEPAPIILHILGSALFCLLGAVQFLPSLRRRRPALHRRLGRIAAAAGCVSALTGLWMTLVFAFPPELQGPLLYWARIALSLSMLGFILRAMVAIRARDIAGHRAAMLRAYAIGQGASTQAALFVIAMAVFDAELLGLPRDIAMALSWGINLAVAEALIRRRRALRILCLAFLAGGAAAAFGVDPSPLLAALAERATDSHTLRWAMLAAYIALLATPFVPGAELGLAILLLFGEAMAAPVYLATILALSIAFAVGRAAAGRAPAPAGTGQGRSPEIFGDGLASQRGRARLQTLARFRWLALIVLINTPGGAIVGGGGGVAMAAGYSRAFSYPAFLACICLAVAPVPALFLFAEHVAIGAHVDRWIDGLGGVQAMKAAAGRP